MDELAEQFEAQLWHTVEEALTEGYAPRRFEQMLRDHGGVQAAKLLIASGDIQYGLERLAELDRLDISLERVMLRPEFEPLFTQDELAAARWRLSQVQ